MEGSKGESVTSHAVAIAAVALSFPFMYQQHNKVALSLSPGVPNFTSPFQKESTLLEMRRNPSEPHEN